jgi:MFS family permease
MAKNRTLMKVSLLSTCLIWASINAITANIPEMAKSFSDVDLYMVELIATVPSLFQMLSVLLSAPIAKRFGLKNTCSLGLLLCGVFGVLPIFVQDFYVVFASRCVFGVGCGLIVSNALSLIIEFFEGPERSSVIGLQGSVGGLGSAVTALVAGRLLAFGWNWSFVVYALAFFVLALFNFGVPAGGAAKETQETTSAAGRGGSVGYLVLQAAFMFCSILTLTLFVVKASTYIVDAGLGDAQQGSLAITLVSVGSLVAGALYGKIRSALSDFALVVFMAIGAAGFAVAALFSSFAAVMVASFLIGYSMMALVPHLQENVSVRCADLGQVGTNTILVAQALGAFGAPYLGTFLARFVPGLPGQFLVCGVIFCVLAVVAWVMPKGRA